MADAVSMSVPYGGAAPQSNFWPIAGLVAAGGAAGLGVTLLVRHLMRSSAAAQTPTPAVPQTPTSPPVLPTPSPVLEAIDYGSLRALIDRAEPSVVLLYCGMTGSGALRRSFDELARATPGITFIAVASEVMPEDTPDLPQVCQQLEGAMFVKRVSPERIEQLDFEDDHLLAIGAPSGVAAPAAFQHAVQWVSNPDAGPAPKRIIYRVDAWTDTNVEPPLLVVPVGSSVELPLSPPDPNLNVQLTNMAGDPVTGPEGGPFWMTPPGSVGFDAMTPGTTVFTAIQGAWRKQALVRAVA